MAKPKNSSAVTITQSVYGAKVGKVRVTKDKWFTEIDARMPIGASDPISRMMRALPRSIGCRFDATEKGHRFFTLLPNVDAVPVLAAVGL